MLGVAVTVIVADECYKAYKRRKVRKAAERDMGFTSLDRREIRRRRRERQREQRDLEREWQRRMRERERQRERLRASGWEGVEVGGGEDGMWDEIDGMGLPEYSLRPRDGVDRAVTVEGLAMKKKGFKSLFKRRQSEPAPVAEGEQRRKRGWFRRKKGRQTGEVSGPPPPPYEEAAGSGHVN